MRTRQEMSQNAAETTISKKEPKTLVPFADPSKDSCARSRARQDHLPRAARSLLQRHLAATSLDWTCRSADDPCIGNPEFRAGYCFRMCRRGWRGLGATAHHYGPSEPTRKARSPGAKLEVLGDDV